MFVAKIVILDILLREEIQKKMCNKITYFRVQSANFVNNWNSSLDEESKYFFLRKKLFLLEVERITRDSYFNWEVNSKSKRDVPEQTLKIEIAKKKFIMNENASVLISMLRKWWHQLKKMVKIFMRLKSKSIS